MTKIRTFFPRIVPLSSNFQESAADTPPSRPASYASVVKKKCRIPLLTKFAIVKRKN